MRDPTSQPFSEKSLGSLLIVDRPDTELTIDLGAQIATNATTGLVANELIDAGASLTSKIRVQGVVWPSVPYFFQNPFAHNISDMLVRVDFDFHIETPWYCSDADGTISVYLFLFLDGERHLQGAVDGTWFSYNGGGPFCTGHITAGLNAAMPNVVSQVGPILQQALSKAAGVPFSNLHYLPGTGVSTPGVFIQNASDDVALGLNLA
ncbi:hypothetical protein [Aliidongia dinghuensis]|nr:hypothetical protein [Aliidongia dinghuensis]